MTEAPLLILRSSGKSIAASMLNMARIRAICESLRAAPQMEPTIWFDELADTVRATIITPEPLPILGGAEVPHETGNRHARRAARAKARRII